MRIARICSGAAIAAIWLAYLASASVSVAGPNCTCRYGGQTFALNACTCIDRGEGLQVACCNMVLNNTSWSFSGKSCLPVSMAPQQTVIQTAERSDRPAPAVAGAISAER
jgi:hypothetical protein